MAKISEDLKPIELLADEQSTPKAVLEGVKALKNWSTGKEVKESEFKKSVSEFLNSPIEGGKNKCLEM